MENEVGAVALFGVFIGLILGFSIGIVVFVDSTTEIDMKRVTKAYAVSTIGNDAEKAAAKADFDKMVAEYVQKMKADAK